MGRGTRGISGKVAQILYGNPKLNKMVQTFQKSLQEVNKTLDGKSTKKKK